MLLRPNGIRLILMQRLKIADLFNYKGDAQNWKFESRKYRGIGRGGKKFVTIKFLKSGSCFHALSQFSVAQFILFALLIFMACEHIARGTKY